MVNICFFQSKTRIFAAELQMRERWIDCNGTMRETYFASQLAVGHRLSMPIQGDLVVDGRWLFEVGGKNKQFKQISGIDDSFVVSDGIDIGHGKKIPLWLFGLLY